MAFTKMIVRMDPDQQNTQFNSNAITLIVRLKGDMSNKQQTLKHKIKSEY